MNIRTPVQDAGRVYKTYAGRLAKLDITTLEDFLFHYPTRYEDYSLLSKIGFVQVGETVTLRGQVLEIKNEYTRNFKKLQKATIADETGSIEIIWFNQPFLTKYIHENDTLSVSGKVEFFKKNIVIQSPEYEIIPANDEHHVTLHTGRLVPVYPETYRVSSKWLRRQIYKILQENVPQEYLPEAVLQKHGLMHLPQAINEIHFPASLASAQKARERLAFDELLLLQLAALKRRSEWNEKQKGKKFEIIRFQKSVEEFIQSLPFTLTKAQQKAVETIFKDMSREVPMNRLLQGDVGSGKTIVAAISMYLAHSNGFQSVLMAPTEILAQQHFLSISKFLQSFGVTVGLQTGSIKHILTNKNKKSLPKTRDQRPETKFDIMIGTHALLSEKVQFEKLGLVIIDEQQRFGVEQRSIIKQKGNNPHLLTMTATPIPRTVALTLYGDLDVSYLNEMPMGRKIIKTWLVPQIKRDAGYIWIKNEIKTHESQAFIICPFIEESESMVTVKAATSEFERLKKDVFPDLRLALLHGKLKAKEKDTILTDFKNHNYDILIATPIVEVGIDISNATIIVIEAAERFGLSQLHQLRGRVGRGDKQSYCLLFTDSKNEVTQERLKAMETMHIGSELAELDLTLRGPGEVYGTLQSGQKTLKIASFSNFPLIERARTEAEKLLPQLSEYPLLTKKLESNAAKTVSPD